MEPSIALALPHTPWKSERASSFGRLTAALGMTRMQWEREREWVDHTDHGIVRRGRVFDERAPNRVWSMTMWRWAASLKDCTHLLQLQDDVVPCEDFWPILRAMLTANPERVIGLQSQHPTGRSLAQMGRRWYRTRAWLVGPQYVLPLQGPDSIHEMLAWLDAHPEVVEKSIGEDVTISTWLSSTGRDVWHPIPAIADVDLTVPSTYEGNDAHDHRRPTVTWQGYSPAQLATVDYWTPPLNVELVPGPAQGECSFCGVKPGFCRSKLGTSICKWCLGAMFETMLNRI